METKKALEGVEFAIMAIDAIGLIQGLRKMKYESDLIEERAM